jgi:hypothetical protein
MRASHKRRRGRWRLDGDPAVNGLVWRHRAIIPFSSFTPVTLEADLHKAKLERLTILLHLFAVAPLFVTQLASTV